MSESNYAFIKDSAVVNVVVFDSPDAELLNQFKEFHSMDSIIACEDNPKAVIGSTYSDGKFLLQKPYPSWVLDENADWQAPTPMPVVEGKFFYWSEDDLTWVEVVSE